MYVCFFHASRNIKNFRMTNTIHYSISCGGWSMLLSVITNSVGKRVTIQQVGSTVFENGATLQKITYIK